MYWLTFRRTLRTEEVERMTENTITSVRRTQNTIYYAIPVLFFMFALFFSLFFYPGYSNSDHKSVPSLSNTNIIFKQAENAAKGS